MIDWMGYLDFRARFAEAIDPRLHSIEFLDHAVASGTAHFWCSDKAAIVAEIRQYPAGGKIVHGVIAAGELDEIAKLVPLAEQWGAENGCIASTIDSRPGWARKMNSAGYGVYQVALWKDLGGRDGA